MSAKVQKMYICVGKEGKGFVAKVTSFISSLARECYSEQHVSGGDSGDLCEEVATVRSYTMENGWIQLYTVTDDSVNGYGECVSVLWEPPDEIEPRFSSWPKFLKFLDENDFVSKHKSLKARPDGWKSFASYLDEHFVRPDKAPFTTKDGKG